MSMQNNLAIAQNFLEKIGSGASPETIAAMFSADLQWHIPGDPSALPWVGRRSGRGAVEAFVRDSSTMMERLRFEVHDLLASNDRAVIVGELASRITATGKLIETPFTIVLTITGNDISQFLMLEDSFAVAAASRTAEP
ncbi:ketosteroid isomerase [Xanthomonas phaseoli pv. phaseoli]|uniref:Ketosteroid isomerase n=1 Tax=Xanthomonas campestris pv. phaseoli TaxID=317013 RepID=A0AB34QJB3_XANCH|nr:MULTISPECIES: nuclear transport factor 2 family protein [Xanthomonas]ATS22658.1 nuclear transport factor 2 family protein [Xanthomonas phaseoli pv. phaseoli]ATS25564.1 nuclear transport factor 2 family protein [Xanthomonas phaseoli pv. phaseoli]ATS30931.1 nuclear transport factor 2 family protein [Xanthomonas phaseoli pv. phaseoli]ATS33815.1 nuclear transport factor 2 family protein [Xanthomonas phaseoli pv. phaseoli]AZU14779.1 ketosteroid isomerase [Xanthomonas phaseoli pv. phaseoli]